jgi:hypothetical protein
MSAAKQIAVAASIAIALMATQYAIFTRQTRLPDNGMPVFHVGFVSPSLEYTNCMSMTDVL